ncbi:hypothetical protein GN956_G3306 [Arapaima gigas]
MKSLLINRYFFHLRTKKQVASFLSKQQLQTKFGCQGPSSSLVVSLAAKTVMIEDEELVLNYAIAGFHVPHTTSPALVHLHPSFAQRGRPASTVLPKCYLPTSHSHWRGLDPSFDFYFPEGNYLDEGFRWRNCKQDSITTGQTVCCHIYTTVMG